MAIAALVLGVVALVFSLIPCVGMLAFIPAVLGVILGALGMKEAKTTDKGKGMATTGLILSVLTIIWIPIYTFAILPTVATQAAEVLEEGMKEAVEEAADPPDPAPDDPAPAP